MGMFVVVLFRQGDKKETRTNGQKARGEETRKLSIVTEKFYWG